MWIFRLLVVCGLVTLSGAGPVHAGISGAVRVIDGDTIDVANTRIRIFGIDAPENDQTCITEQGQTWACGAWVSATVARAFTGKQALCEQVDRDRYGRVVARCRIQGQDIGEMLVAQGLAFAYLKYSDDYELTEKGAAIRDAGLHASRVQDPAQFRRTRASGRIPPDQACRVKGNISASGERIYHVPGQQHYERTGIKTEYGERWFCSAQQARAAGWRAAKR